MIEMSGITRSLSTPLSSSGITPATLGSRKGISPHVTPPTAHMNPVFSQFFSKLDNSGSAPPLSGRVSVFSPPVNGKIGGIPPTPSPSTALRNLKLSSAHMSGRSQANDKFLTPTCSQESTSECNFNLNTESVTSSPLDVWQSKNPSSNEMYQYKKDPRRVVVHPYSPDE